MARACNRHHYEDEESEEDYEPEWWPDESDYEDEEGEEDYEPERWHVENDYYVTPAAYADKQELEDSKSPSRTEVSFFFPFRFFLFCFVLTTQNFKALESNELKQLFKRGAEAKYMN